MEYLWKNCDPRVDSVRRSWHHGVPDDGVSDPAPEISLQSRKLIQDTYNLPVLKGSVGIVRRLLIGTATVEIAGAVLYSFWFVPEYGFWKGIGYSIFHAVSAFCNAGIDLVGEASFAPFVTNPLINFTTMGLILLSGLGFPSGGKLWSGCRSL